MVDQARTRVCPSPRTERNHVPPLRAWRRRRPRRLAEGAAEAVRRFLRVGRRGRRRGVCRQEGAHPHPLADGSARRGQRRDILHIRIAADVQHRVRRRERRPHGRRSALQDDVGPQSKHGADGLLRHGQADRRARIDAPAGSGRLPDRTRDRSNARPRSSPKTPPRGLAPKTSPRTSASRARC